VTPELKVLPDQPDLKDQLHIKQDQLEVPDLETVIIHGISQTVHLLDIKDGQVI
jgi:hypothetical protein